MEVVILKFQHVKVVECEFFMDKLYFYLLDQTNGDYNTITHAQPDNPTAINDEDREKE